MTTHVTNLNFQTLPVREQEIIKFADSSIISDLHILSLVNYLNVKDFNIVNSQAGDMAVVRPYGFEIDFVRNPITGSAA